MTQAELFEASKKNLPIFKSLIALRREIKKQYPETNIDWVLQDIKITNQSILDTLKSCMNIKGFCYDLFGDNCNEIDPNLKLITVKRKGSKNYEDEDENSVQIGDLVHLEFNEYKKSVGHETNNFLH